MILSFLRPILVAVFALLALGCASGEQPGMITSTSPLPPGVRGTIPTYGSDCQTYILGMIPITSSPNTQAALNDAKQAADVDVLTDVTIDENSFYWILFSNRCVRVRGMGVAR